MLNIPGTRIATKTAATSPAIIAVQRCLLGIAGSEARKATTRPTMADRETETKQDKAINVDGAHQSPPTLEVRPEKPRVTADTMAKGSTPIRTVTCSSG